MNDALDMNSLIDAYLRGEASDAELAALREQVAKEPSLARRIYAQAEMEQELTVLFQAAPFLRSSGVASAKTRSNRRIPWVVLAAAAALLAVGGLWMRNIIMPSAFSPRHLAFITAVSGACRLQMSGARSQNTACKIGDAIRAGMNIKTAKGGELTFKYAGEKTELVVGEVSSVECRMSKKGEKRLYLSIGQLSATVAKQAPGEAFVLETPQAKVTVVGTKFRLVVLDATNNQHASTSCTRLDVGAGLVQFVRLSDGATTNVASGRFAIVGKGLELAAYPAGTAYIKGRLLLQEDFEKGLDRWDLVQATNGARKDFEPAFLPLQTNTNEVECRIVPGVGGRTGKCLMLSAGRDQERCVGIRLKQAAGPFIMEWEGFACKETFGAKTFTPNMGTDQDSFMNVFYIDTPANKPDVWTRFQTEATQVAPASGNHALTARQPIFPFIVVTNMKGYVDNIRIWELVAVEKTADGK